MIFDYDKTKKALGEAQLTLKWTVLISKASVVAGDFSEDLQIMVTTSTVPETDSQMVQVEIGGHVINQNGKQVRNGSIVWTFVENTDAAVTEYFYNWIKARENSKNSDLKADLTMQLMGPDESITQTYTLIGAMPKLEVGSTWNQAADQVNPSITWEYDDYEWKKGA